MKVIRTKKFKFKRRWPWSKPISRWASDRIAEIREFIFEYIRKDPNVILVIHPDIITMLCCDSNTNIETVGNIETTFIELIEYKLHLNNAAGTTVTAIMDRFAMPGSEPYVALRTYNTDEVTILNFGNITPTNLV